MTEFAVDKITVGHRYRQELGDLTNLAESIKQVGLLHPIVVTSTGQLIAGLRRLEACKQNGCKRVQVTVVDLDDLLRGQRDENVCRLDLQPSEAVALGMALEERESAASKERQQEHGKTAPGRAKDTSGKLPPVSDIGKTRDKIGKAVGMSGRTFEKAEAVVDSGDKKLIAVKRETRRWTFRTQRHCCRALRLRVPADTRFDVPIQVSGAQASHLQTLICGGGCCRFVNTCPNGVTWHWERDQAKVPVTFWTWWTVIPRSGRISFGRIGREQRLQVVTEMYLRGSSTRAVAATLNTSLQGAEYWLRKGGCLLRMGRPKGTTLPRRPPKSVHERMAAEYGVSWNARDRGTCLSDCV